MGLAPLLQEPKLNESQMALRHQFLERTGYGSSDILSLNYGTGIFLMLNGGKYRVIENDVEYIAGPPVDMEDRLEL
jgi:hypothetical protein